MTLFIWLYAVETVSLSCVIHKTEAAIRPLTAAQPVMKVMVSFAGDRGTFLFHGVTKVISPKTHESTPNLFMYLIDLRESF